MIIFSDVKNSEKISIAFEKKRKRRVRRESLVLSSTIHISVFEKSFPFNTKVHFDDLKFERPSQRPQRI